jgi:hypothetical protein
MKETTVPELSAAARNTVSPRSRLAKESPGA